MVADKDSSRNQGIHIGRLRFVETQTDSEKQPYDADHIRVRKLSGHKRRKEFVQRPFEGRIDRPGRRKHWQ